MSVTSPAHRAVPEPVEAGERRTCMNVLANQPVFETTASKTLEDLLEATTFLRFAPGAMLVEEGAEAVAMVALLEGVARAVHSNGAELEYTPVIFRAPAQFADLAGLAGTGRYGSSVQTLTGAVAAFIPMAALKHALATDHGLCERWLYSVARQFSESIQCRRQQFFADDSLRMAQLLLSYAEAVRTNAAERVTFHLSYGALARQIGCTRRSAIRLMKTLEERHAVMASTQGWSVHLEVLRAQVASGMTLLHSNLQ